MCGRKDYLLDNKDAFLLDELHAQNPRLSLVLLQSEFLPVKLVLETAVNGCGCCFLPFCDLSICSPDVNDASVLLFVCVYQFGIGRNNLL